MKKKIPIIIESVDEKGYWGRVYIEDNLIVDYSKTLEGLKKKMNKLVFDFHGLVGSKYAFEIQYGTDDVPLNPMKVPGWDQPRPN
jgi:hypothetical protein